jgi:hypothetical protein
LSFSLFSFLFVYLEWASDPFLVRKARGWIFLLLWRKVIQEPEPFVFFLLWDDVLYKDGRHIWIYGSPLLKRKAKWIAELSFVGLDIVEEFGPSASELLRKQ